MKIKRIPRRCWKCMERRKRFEAQRWEDALVPFFRIPEPGIAPKVPFLLFRIFKQMGGSR